MDAQPVYYMEGTPGNGPAYENFQAPEKLASTHYAYLHGSGLCVKEHKYAINFTFLQAGSELNY